MEVWINARAASAILQLGTDRLSQMRRAGQLSSSGKENEYKLSEILERYQRLLRTQGLVAEEREAICIREFRAGKHPEEVMIEHQYPFEIVKQAWDHHLAFARDPEAVRVENERLETVKKEEATRCRSCARAQTESRNDTLRIVRETTGDETREDFTLLEERACTGLDMRCPSCRMLKATASLDAIKARLRVLVVMGAPKPIDVDRDMPLPTPPDAAGANGGVPSR